MTTAGDAHVNHGGPIASVGKRKTVVKSTCQIPPAGRYSLNEKPEKKKEKP